MAKDAASLDINFVLKRAFPVLFKNFPIIFPLAVLAAFIPVSVEIVYLWGKESLIIPPRVELCVLLLQSVSFMLLLGAAVYIVYPSLRTISPDGRSVGQSASFAETLHWCRPRFVPLLQVALAAGVLIGLGNQALLLPGIILVSFFVMTVPVCMVEHLGVRDSFTRSKQLAYGNRLEIFLLQLVMASLIIVAVPAVASGYIEKGTFFVWAKLLAVLVSGLLQAMSAIVFSIIYYDLRFIKDGINLDNLDID